MTSCIRRGLPVLAWILFLSGCGELAKLTKPSIVGKWTNNANPSDAMEFFPDGTVQEVTPYKTTNGQYTLLEENRVKLEMEGLLYGTNTTIWNYSVNGAKLAMTTEGNIGLTVNWTKAPKE